MTHGKLATTLQRTFRCWNKPDFTPASVVQIKYILQQQTATKGQSIWETWPLRDTVWWGARWGKQRAAPGVREAAWTVPKEVAKKQRHWRKDAKAQSPNAGGLAGGQAKHTRGTTEVELYGAGFQIPPGQEPEPPGWVTLSNSQVFSDDCSTELKQIDYHLVFCQMPKKARLCES